MERAHAHPQLPFACEGGGDSDSPVYCWIFTIAMCNVDVGVFLTTAHITKATPPARWVLVAGLPDFNCQARTLLVVVVVTGRGRETYITRELFLDLRCYAAEAAGVGSLHSARCCTGSVGGRGGGMVAVVATARFRFLCFLQGAGVFFAASPKRQETT